jgi:hypothetical protein
MSDNYSSLPEMPTEDLPYAVASHIAYQYYYDGDPVLTQDKLTSMMEGYSIDENLSNDVGVVLKKDNENAILAYRGTDPTNVYDLNADAQLATGINNLLPFQTRLSRAEDLYNSTKNKYNNLELTGHSLGGYLADHISRKNNEKAVIFNPGLTFITTHTLPPVGNIKPIVYETDNFDLLSHSVHNRVYSSEVDLRTITQRENLTEWGGSHNLDSFLPLERIENKGFIPDDPLPSFVGFNENKGFTPHDPLPSFVGLNETNVCKEQPYLVFCKKPKLQIQIK